MCILFLFMNNEPADGEYQVIIASNRDEVFKRPTKSVGRWSDHPHCISGIDLDPDKAGGTWLGVSEKGKIAALLNVASGGTPDETKKGRGFLVADFLSDDISPTEYTSSLVGDRHLYNGFNLILMEKRMNKWGLHFLGSHDEDSPSILETGVYGWSNSPMSSEWQKVSVGRSNFTEIIHGHQSTSDRGVLVEQLMTLLSDPTPHLPDANLEAIHSGKGRHIVNKLSAIFVDLNLVSYGSRTSSIILVDHAGNGELIEKTMREPIDASDPIWDTQSITFHMKDTISPQL